MMDSLFQSVMNGITAQSFLPGAALALALGGLLAFTYTRRARYTQSFVLTLVLLPFAVQTVILLVNGSVGTGIAVAGAFSLVRFRSAPGNAKDIAVIFLAMAVGLACGSGYLLVALLFGCLSCLVLYLLVRFHVGEAKDPERELHITIPESLDYTAVFDDLFADYAKEHDLIEVKTASLGSLYKLRYRVRLKKDVSEKEFLDALRCRNGNLEISFGRPQSAFEQL